MARHRATLAVFAVFLAALAVGCAPSGRAGGNDATAPGVAPTAAPIPIPGHEVYGFVPYWEMDDGIADHVASTPLTTIGLFSVTHGRDGAVATGENGYRRIVGPVGRRLAEDAAARGDRVELVYTSFGFAKNERFFGGRDLQDRAIADLVRLVGELGLDGVNVDVEQVRARDVPAYAAFVGRLREALRAVDADAQVSVATAANAGGAAMALAAAAAGADRIFMMAYDYHWAGSTPGASAPMGRRDGDVQSLPWSLDLYRDLGVPVERTVLGLPLYGMAWPTDGPDLWSSSTGRGAAWIPRRNLDVLTGPAEPTHEPIEDVAFLAVPDGDAWQAIYFDTAETLGRKLALADARGLAGAGLWALGYERGRPEFTELLATFHAGELAPPD